MAITIALTGVRVGMMFATVERHAAILDEQRRALGRTLADLRAAEAERIRLLDRTVRATEEERSRVAVELHDGPIQQMSALSFRMGTHRARLRASDGGAVDVAIDTVEREIGDSIRELRRLMSDLRPPALDEGGLEVALREQVELFQRRTGLRATFESALDGELEPDAQVVLYRIAQEALTNVTKHAHASHVSVRLTTPNHHATLEVSDDGVGFDETLARHRAKDGNFGLAAMDQRASMVGGSLEVRSAPGGATLSGRGRPRQDHPVSAPLRMVIADDEPLILETLAELLEEEGFEVVARVADGSEAIRAVGELHPDAVLVDVRMPLLNGIEATRRIRDDHPDTVVIALSAYDDPALASAAREAGAADYVAKGTPARELIDRIIAATSA